MGALKSFGDLFKSGRKKFFKLLWEQLLKNMVTAIFFLLAVGLGIQTFWLRMEKRAAERLDPPITVYLHGYVQSYDSLYMVPAVAFFIEGNPDLITLSDSLGYYVIEYEKETDEPFRDLILVKEGYENGLYPKIPFPTEEGDSLNLNFQIKPLDTLDVPMKSADKETDANSILF